jgi:hypothetical protein
MVIRTNHKWRLRVLAAAAGVLVADLVGISPLASPAFASSASTSPAALYAYAAGTATTATACPATATIDQECPLATALGLVRAGGSVLLETPGSSGSYYGNFSLDTKSTSATKAVTIRPASGVTNPTLDGDASGDVTCPTPSCDGAVLTTGSGDYTNIDSLTVTDANNTTGNGGGIDDGGSLALSDVTISDDQAANGGAVYVENEGSLTSNGSEFSSDGAPNGDGGAIDSGDNGGTGSVSVSDSTFTDDTSYHDGAAIASGDHGGKGTLSVSHSTFSGGSNGYGDGGAIDSGDYSGSKGALTVTDSTFTDDSSSIDGGAIDSEDHGATGSLSVTGSRFTDDEAESYGGAINSTNSGSKPVGITDSEFDGDYGSYGGAVSSYEQGTGSLVVSGSTFHEDSAVEGASIETGGSASGNATVTTSTFTDGYSYGAGGSIDVYYGNLKVTGSSFSGNYAEEGGAIFNQATTTVSESTFADDTASDDGGAIDSGDDGNYNDLTVNDSTFSNNSANDGGAIDNADDYGYATTNVSFSTFTWNSASNSGGAIDSGNYGGYGTVSVVNSTLYDNEGNATLDNVDGSLTIAGSIVADSETQDCEGTITDAGYNYENDASTSCGFQASTDVVGGSPDLGSLAENGGDTETFEPEPSSPLIARIPNPTTVTIGSGSVALCPSTDQRGVTTPPGAVECSIGSVDIATSFDPQVEESGSISAPAGEQIAGSEACPPGTVVVGGGVSGSAVGDVNSSYPEGNGWQVAFNQSPVAGASFNVYAVCSPEPAAYKVVTSAAADNPAEAHSKVTATCPAGSQVLGGGGSSTGGTSVTLDESTPADGSWDITINNAGSADETAKAYVICAKGLDGYSVEAYKVTVGPGKESEAGLDCPSGMLAAGGGVSSSSASLDNSLVSLWPDYNGWDAYWYNGTSSTLAIKYNTLCADA